MALRSRTEASSSERPPGARATRKFFDRATTTVARDLLGAVLRVGDRAVRLVETEAYVANDPANHAYRGPTRRNRSMFGEPGTLYVYRIHQVVCANLVTRRGEAVLLRAGEPLTAGLASTSGPGRLCRALGIERSDDGTRTTVDRRIRIDLRPGRRGKVAVGRRVGLRRARGRRLRFAIRGNPWVSRPRLDGRGRSAPGPRRSGAADGRQHLGRRAS